MARMLQEKWLICTELPKTSERAPSRSFHLWSTPTPHAQSALLRDELFANILYVPHIDRVLPLTSLLRRLRTRLNFEKQRLDLAGLTKEYPIIARPINQERVIRRFLKAHPEDRFVALPLPAPHHDNTLYPATMLGQTRPTASRKRRTKHNSMTMVTTASARSSLQ